MRSKTLIALASLALATGIASAEQVWLEAEAATRTDFPPPAQNPFGPADAEQADKLSGGAWIGTSGDQPGRFLEYDFDVPAAGDYQLYSRKFWKHGPYRWRVDQDGQLGTWAEVGRDVALLDSVELRLHTVANWTAAGPASLKQGPATLRVQLLDTDGAAAFDAWLLTTDAFAPRGKLKPGDLYDVTPPEGWFTFQPPADGDDPLVTLRDLNEPEAGSNGFIAADGESFVHADTGEPVQFWAVNAGMELAQMDPASVDQLAAFLARRGVNMVRLHGTSYPARGDITATDAERIGQIQYFVAALKREGIYTNLSIYFPLWVRLDAADGWDGYDDQIPFALIFFDPEFQEAWRGWYRDLLASDNPHTGVPLARDPAVAIAEIVNEDSLFFWTFTPGENVPSEQMATLNEQFAAWLAEKHGSVDAAIASWGGAHDAAEVPPVWRLFNVRDAYSRDAAAFLTELQRGFYEDATAYLKDDLGFGGVVSASNWITADARHLEPLEKLSYLATDLTDRHGYYEPAAEGDGAGYSVREGHTYADRSAARFDRSNPNERGEGPAYSHPLMNAIYGDDAGPKPSIMSEFDWVQPNRFRAEMPLIAAAYSRLQGLDAPHFFALSGPGWQGQIGKFPVQLPDAIGQFPAFSAIYRMGLVKEGPVAVRVTAGVDRLKELGGAPTVSAVNLDALRAADVPDGQTASVGGVDAIDPRAFFVGKVRVDLLAGDAEAGVEMLDLARHVSDGRVDSATGELSWDHGRGVIVVNAPAAKAVTGFLREAGSIGLGDGVTIESPIEYGTLAIVALDGEPIGQSKRLLVQAMTEVQNLGYETEDAGEGRRRISKLGGPPLIVREFAGTIAIPGGGRVTPLDASLAASGEPVELDGVLELSPTTLYYLIERE